MHVALQHSDRCSVDYILPFWRAGDPVLSRTPPCDRSCGRPWSARGEGERTALEGYDPWARIIDFVRACVVPGPDAGSRP